MKYFILINSIFRDKARCDQEKQRRHHTTRQPEHEPEDHSEHRREARRAREGHQHIHQEEEAHHKKRQYREEERHQRQEKPEGGSSARWRKLRDHVSSSQKDHRTSRGRERGREVEEHYVKEGHGHHHHNHSQGANGSRRPGVQSTIDRERRRSGSRDGDLGRRRGSEAEADRRRAKEKAGHQEHEQHHRKSKPDDRRSYPDMDDVFDEYSDDEERGYGRRGEQHQAWRRKSKDKEDGMLLERIEEAGNSGKQEQHYKDCDCHRCGHRQQQQRPTDLNVRVGIVLFFGEGPVLGTAPK